MKRPSRGERESETTMRSNGALWSPNRLSRILTAMSVSPPRQNQLCACRMRMPPAGLPARCRRCRFRSSERKPHPLAEFFHHFLLAASAHHRRELLHHFLHVLELLDEPVDVLDRRAAAFGDAPAAA